MIVVSGRTLKLQKHRESRIEEAEVAVSDLVIAGWTGRDPKAVQRHIAELAALGVPPPPQTPCFYRVSAGLLTTEEGIEVVGGDTNGEAMFVLFSLPDGLWVGAGSDHADRKVREYSSTISKQVCPKPLAPEIWPYAEVAGHWDELVLRSYVITGSEHRLYQQEQVSAIRHPEDLLSRYSGRGVTLPVGTAMFCGTLATKESVQGAIRFEFELEDPVRGRKIRHGYNIRVIEPVD